MFFVFFLKWLLFSKQFQAKPSKWFCVTKPQVCQFNAMQESPKKKQCLGSDKNKLRSVWISREPALCISLLSFCFAVLMMFLPIDNSRKTVDCWFPSHRIQILWAGKPSSQSVCISQPHNRLSFSRKTASSKSKQSITLKFKSKFADEWQQW